MMIQVLAELLTIKLAQILSERMQIIKIVDFVTRKEIQTR